MTRAIVLLAVLGTTTAARADIEIASDPPPAPPAPTAPSRPRPIGIAYRLGMTKLPLAGETVDAISLIGLDADIRLVGDLHAFAGIRLGFKIYSDEPGSTGAYGAELTIRAIALRDGAGLGFTLGMNWGD